ncbi:MAG TPA: YbjN domain-containing protein [Acidimicrobiales bacterium]|nr:YbjN domain-containing protein [Acidimicrobiales bacterium]
MPLVDLPDEGAMAATVQRIGEWIERERSPDGTFGLVAAEHQDVTDRTASHRWYLRFKGDEKDFITVWLTLRQRTLHHEAQFMPAPEEHVTEVLQYLMRRNTELYGMAFCLGPEDAVYLVGRVPAALVDDEELDRIAGSSILYVDEHFPTAMTLGHPAMYRRRPRR